MDWRLLVPFCDLLVLVLSGYQPFGDEVQAGSVLLPATRRGRYLANIIKRQAVDGTGITFNKNADRMNAEAKKKVDVLSDDLLPYIIGEQERRTTLHMRVMTAIQNGEKGVTIAEIRNKPPLFIRKGLMYRCPSNLAILEPDGSGIMLCEKDVAPSLITYDSCLSAEDRDLYVANDKYFFCNRHRVEGPDLPKNGSAVIACAPAERTSLNYTYAKCALEDSEDVVVHYRYYPDRTYKYVEELDPDHEVCDHWRPCQIGYIFSLPAPDQASLVHELWNEYQYVEDAVPDTTTELVTDETTAETSAHDEETTTHDEETTTHEEETTNESEDPITTTLSDTADSSIPIDTEVSTDGDANPTIEEETTIAEIARSKSEDVTIATTVKVDETTISDMARSNPEAIVTTVPSASS